MLSTLGADCRIEACGLLLLGEHNDYHVVHKPGKCLCPNAFTSSFQISFLYFLCTKKN